MSRLGIERETGLVYEGRENASYLTLPSPVLSQCCLSAVSVHVGKDAERLGKASSQHR